MARCRQENPREASPYLFICLRWSSRSCFHSHPLGVIFNGDGYTEEWQKEVPLFSIISAVRSFKNYLSFLLVRPLAVAFPTTRPLLTFSLPPIAPRTSSSSRTLLVSCHRSGQHNYDPNSYPRLVSSTSSTRTSGAPMLLLALLATAIRSSWRPRLFA